MSDDSKKVQKKFNKREAAEQEAAVEELASKFVAALVHEVYGAMLKEEKRYGDSFGATAKVSFLASFISTLIYEAMSRTGTEGLELSTATELVNKNFQQCKTAVEYAVAAAFEGAMIAWRGQDANSEKVQRYNCSITPEPEAINKLEC
jgi:hypothetical protein